MWGVGGHSVWHHRTERFDFAVPFKNLEIHAGLHEEDTKRQATNTGTHNEDLGLAVICVGIVSITGFGGQPWEGKVARAAGDGQVRLAAKVIIIVVEV